ncbi:hypothetical protein K170097C1_37540 [Hungatella effluvii]|uniref:Uncharacterized protein n=1 Tax=Hungatella hathewayi TaxID=154046 RepID=A0AA37N343_9FIRM|nr:hypothetical protein CE91St55_18240 [Hungatella hathewayi]GKH06666.1 hypothetical protein CE91St54_17740 [Hungatella hathewayi]
MSGAPIDFWTLCPEVRKAQGQSFCGAGLVLFLIGQTETCIVMLGRRRMFYEQSKYRGAFLRRYSKDEQRRTNRYKQYET